MAGDDDFIKSGKVGVGRVGEILTDCVYVHIFFFFVPFPVHRVHEAAEMAGGMKWETNLILSAFN